ncbi:head GIN domain-containing protein [Christiangramia aquimixticola]|uniref:head GIN domain-containing protein n=1 Tax=Christiangramia aquimixticola TaxID=1697558 RepID=UPI003AA91613
MKKTILLFATILMTFSCMNAQWETEKVEGNGNLVTNERTVSSYEGVRLAGSLNVELIRGTAGKLEIQAESNLQEFIKTEVRNNVLHISTKKGINLHPNKPILITVPVETLREVALTGSGKILGKNTLSTSNMDVELTGSGDMELILEAETITGKITGSGDISISGKAEKFKCMVTGSGDFDAQNLSTDIVDARVSGSGDIIVNPGSSLKGSVSGSGDIRYKGKPEKIDVKTHGSGKVTSF